MGKRRPANLKEDHRKSGGGSPSTGASSSKIRKSAYAEKVRRRELAQDSASAREDDENPIEKESSKENPATTVTEKSISTTPVRENPVDKKNACEKTADREDFLKRCLERAKETNLLGFEPGSEKHERFFECLEHALQPGRASEFPEEPATFSKRFARILAGDKEKPGRIGKVFQSALEKEERIFRDQDPYARANLEDIPTMIYGFMFEYNPSGRRKNNTEISDQIETFATQCIKDFWLTPPPRHSAKQTSTKACQSR